MVRRHLKGVELEEREMFKLKGGIHTYCKVIMIARDVGDQSSAAWEIVLGSAFQHGFDFNSLS